MVRLPVIRGGGPRNGTQSTKAGRQSARCDSKAVENASPDRLSEVKPAEGARVVPSAQGRLGGGRAHWRREATMLRAQSGRAVAGGQDRRAALGRWRTGGAGLQAGKAAPRWQCGWVPRRGEQASETRSYMWMPSWVPWGGEQALSRDRGLGLIPSGEESAGRMGRGWGGERGSGSLLAVAASLGLIGFALVAVWVVAWFACLHRADQVADLAASAGAEAFLSGGDPCSVAGSVAQSNSARLESCEAGGDTARFVVKVEVAVPLRPRVPGAPEQVSSRAAAGVVE